MIYNQRGMRPRDIRGGGEVSEIITRGEISKEKRVRRGSKVNGRSKASKA